MITVNIGDIRKALKIKDLISKNPIDMRLLKREFYALTGKNYKSNVKVFDINKVEEIYEIVSRSGREFLIDTYRWNGYYWLNINEIKQGNKFPYKGKWFNTKDEMIKNLKLCFEYLYDNDLY